MANYNVLIVHNYYRLPGGESSVVKNEKQMLEKNGNMVFLYTRDNKEIDSFTLLQKFLLPLNYLFNLKTYRDIQRIIKEKNIDIVHVHNTINIISPAVYYAAFKMKRPVVQTIHNFRLLCPNGLFYREGNICEDCVEKGLNEAVKHNCYRDSRFQTMLSVLGMKIQRGLKLYSRLNYICLTEFNRNKLLMLKQIDPKRVYIKPNYAADESDGILLKKDRKKQFVFASRLDEYKGIKFLFEAWRKVNKDIDLIVFGDGLLRKWCEDYIAENSIPNIKMMGNVENTAVKETMKKSYGTIIASKLYEGFPMSIVESLSYGTPVAAPDMGNSGVLIKDGINGYKYVPGSIEGFLGTINNIIENESLIKTTRTDYLNKYTEEINYKTLIRIYENCLDTM